MKDSELEEHSPGVRAHSTTNYASPHELAMEKFARRIVQGLESAAHLKEFNKVHIFAEPHFLGRIKAEIPRSLKNIEISWIAKDLEKATADEILERVS